MSAQRALRRKLDRAKPPGLPCRVQFCMRDQGSDGFCARHGTPASSLERELEQAGALEDLPRERRAALLTWLLQEKRPEQRVRAQEVAAWLKKGRTTS